MLKGTTISFILILLIFSTACTNVESNYRNNESETKAYTPPFTADEVKNKWDYSDGTLLKVVKGPYHNFYWQSQDQLDIIIGSAREAEFQKRVKNTLVFLGHGKIDAPVTFFPYKITFDLNTRAYKQEELFLDVEETAFWGIRTDGRLMSNLSWDNNSVILSFKTINPKESGGPIEFLPYTETEFDRTKQLLSFYIYGTKVSEEVLKKISEFKGNSFIKTIKVMQKNGRPSQFKHVLEELGLFRDNGLEKLPLTVVELVIDKESKYNVQDVKEDKPGEIIRMEIKFQPK